MEIRVQIVFHELHGPPSATHRCCRMSSAPDAEGRSRTFDRIFTLTNQRGTVSTGIELLCVSIASPWVKGRRVSVPLRPRGRILKQRLSDHGLVQILHNLPAGNWAGGERGIACLPDPVAVFKSGVDKASSTPPRSGLPR